jgi:hypothetical protein
MWLVSPTVHVFGPWIGGVLILALLPAARSRLGVALIAIGSQSCIVLGLVAAGLWSLLLRDGLGPDMVVTEGRVAAQRIWSLFYPALLVGWGVATISGVASWWRWRQVKQAPFDGTGCR